MPAEVLPPLNEQMDTALGVVARLPSGTLTAGEERDAVQRILAHDARVLSVVRRFAASPTLPDHLRIALGLSPLAMTPTTVAAASAIAAPANAPHERKRWPSLDPNVVVQKCGAVWDR